MSISICIGEGLSCFNDSKHISLGMIAFMGFGPKGSIPGPLWVGLCGSLVGITIINVRSMVSGPCTVQSPSKKTTTDITPEFPLCNAFPGKPVQSDTSVPRMGLDNKSMKVA